jgi:hypothetical protein
VAVHAEARPDRGEGARAPFLLLLRGPADEVLPDGLYALAIEDGPTFDLYVSPVHTPSRAHQDYQVVVN